MMQEITSKDNSLIKHIIKLKNKKYRNEFCEYIVEGIKIVKEAIEEKARIKQIIVSKNTLNSELFESHLKKELEKIEYVQVTENIFKLISDVEEPQGVLAIIEKEKNNLEIDYSEDFILALDDIQDPGNLGTIIRTADSCNIKQILISKGTVDPYNQKVIRSTMGAIFRVNIIECEKLASVLEKTKQNNYKVISAALGSGKTIYDVKYNKTVVVIGNEANGISKKVLNMSDEKVIIPMLGKTESLNASVAAGIIMYEYVRQKFSIGDGPFW